MWYNANRKRFMTPHRIYKLLLNTENKQIENCRFCVAVFCCCCCHCCRARLRNFNFVRKSVYFFFFFANAINQNAMTFLNVLICLVIVLTIWSNPKIYTNHMKIDIENTPHTYAKRRYHLNCINLLFPNSKRLTYNVVQMFAMQNIFINVFKEFGPAQSCA